jgi:HEPN domain-containing protein
VRVGDAQALLKARRWDGAYYLAGYAIECALKACIARSFRRDHIPDDPKLLGKIYVHDLRALLNLAGLKSPLDTAMSTDPQLEVAWGNVVRWTETSRYERRRSEPEARDLVDAVCNPAHGMIQWIQQYW